MDIERRIAIMQARDLLVSIILGSAQPKVDENKTIENTIEKDLSAIQLKDNDFSLFLQLLKILFIQQVQMPITQQYDYTYKGENFSAIPWQHPIINPSFQKLLNFLEKLLTNIATQSTITELGKSILESLEKEIQSDISNYEEYPDECGLIEAPIVFDNKEIGTEKMRLNYSTNIRLVSRKTFSFQREDVSIYADEAQTNLLYKFSNKTVSNIRVNLPECYLAKRTKTTGIFQAIPCGYLSLEENSDKNFNLAFVSWMFNVLTQIYHQTKDKSSSPIRSFIEDDSILLKLTSMVENEHVLGKIPLILIICRLINVRQSPLPRLDHLFNLERNITSRIQNNNQELALALNELLISLQYVLSVKNLRGEKQSITDSTSSIKEIKDSDESVSENITITDVSEEIAQEDEQMVEGELSEMINSSFTYRNSSWNEVYRGLIDVIACLIDNVPPTHLLAQKIISAYFTRTVTKESPHPFVLLLLLFIIF